MRKELLKKLDEATSGDPVAAAAAKEIRHLESAAINGWKAAKRASRTRDLTSQAEMVLWQLEHS